MSNSSASSDFKAVLAITNPSPLTKQMLDNLPDDYDKSQSTGNFAAVYATGYEFERLKQTLQQTEANNYLYSPDTQEDSFKVTGAGKYLIEFNIPFVTPPLNVSIVGSDFTDAFIEYSSRFGMIVNVLTNGQDTLQYRASGFVGAASDEHLGDGLFNNFGALYQFPRVGDSVINESYVKFYEKTNQFINVHSIIPVQTLSGPVIRDSNGIAIAPYPAIISSTPPISQSYVKGLIRPTNVVTSPQSTHELVDISGNLIALLDASNTSQNVISFFQNSGDNFFKSDPQVYITGAFSTFEFNRWRQPNYTQEVFRADNKYRRILSGINKSLALGPTVAGVSNMVEALIAQPFIPHSVWDDSDFRIFKNTKGLNSPKYNIGKANSQYEGYPTAVPKVEVRRVLQPWTPDNITYNTKPKSTSFENPVIQSVGVLNNATRFDITNELTRSLRLGIDVPQGGIINWNYQNTSVTIPASGSPLYELYNYVFLNNPGDSIANINIFWYAQQTNANGPTDYKSFGPLQYGRDYFVIPTAKFLLPNGKYQLPSELLQGYNCNSSIPYASGIADSFGNLNWMGTDLVNANKLPSNTPALPQFVVQLDLRNLSVYNNGISTKMPTNLYDFILYSYGQITTTQARASGSYPDRVAANGTYKIASYYDADTSSALQPSDSPFSTAQGKLPPTALAQSSFAKLVSNTNYEYITTMIGGQLTFNKTVYIDSIKRQTSVNGTNLTPPSVLVIQALKIATVTPPASAIGQVGTNQYTLTGKVDRAISTTTGNRYFEFDFGDYVLLDAHGNPIAIFDNSSPIQFGQIVGQTITVTGVVFYTIWDTRIPVSYYRTGSPVFQAAANFPSTVEVFTPDIIASGYNNENYLVRIDGLPKGNQQTITASWTFNILPTSGTFNQDSSALAFSDTIKHNQSGADVHQFGVMSQFTGLVLSQTGVDPDNASYEQDYESPSFSGYFLNYNDYINAVGSKLSTFGDSNATNTLTNPILNKPLPSEARLNTILNFFSPKYGFVSLSILPNMEFYMTGSGAPVSIVRPNNNGIALQMSGDSYAGLVFYGKNSDKIVDKPTRLIVDFTYSTADQQARKKIVEVEDGGFANWVDGKNPDTVQDSSVFFVTGNEFKYSHESYDQPVNQYADNGPETVQNAGQYYDRFPTDGSEPIFHTDPSQNALTTSSDRLGEPGPPARYRRPNLNNNTSGVYQTPGSLAVAKGYLNITPEKIAYIQFDLTGFPVDAIINNGILEVYFASGFTIKQGKDVNFELNHNIAWQKSRLSGNGKTFVKKLTNPDGTDYTVLQPLGNVHWRKNFFEIVIPYAFNSEPADLNYGIRKLFSNNSANSLPAPQNPQPNLEYLGFLNIDEINTASLTATTFIEDTVGLANIILSTSSIIYKVDGILSFGVDSNANTTLLNPFDQVNGKISSLDSSKFIGQFINQTDVLPNMKVLIYPFGLGQNIFFYGYVKSLLPANLVGFTDNDIAVYQKALNYVQPLYSEYVVKLLESDTYFPYRVFGKETTVEDTSNDIAY